MIEITAGQRLIADPQKASQPTFRGSQQSAIHRIHRCRLATVYGHFHRRDIVGRDAQGTGGKFPVQSRQNTADARGEAGIHRNHRQAGGAGFAQIRMVVGIQHRLIIHGRMDGGNGARFNAEGAVQHVDNRHNAVGGTGGGGGDMGFCVQLTVIDTKYYSRNIRLSRLRQQGIVGPLLQMGTYGVAAVIMAGAFQHQIHPRPMHILQRFVMGHRNAITFHHQRAVRRRHLARKATVGTVVLGQVNNRCQIRGLVNGHNLHLTAIVGFIQGSQYAAPDATITIDRQPDHSGRQSSTAATTASAVISKYSNSWPAGADSPKLVIPTMRPSRPTYLYQ